MNTKKYKKLKESDVLEVTETLCKNNQTTTTLEVKNYLRRQGFFAKQQDISMLMDRLNDNGDVTWAESGSGWRIYSLVDPILQTKSQDVLGTSISTSPTPIPIPTNDSSNGDSNDDDNSSPKKTRKVKVGDWKCYLANPIVGVPFYESYIGENLTRNQARWKYTKQVDMNEYKKKYDPYINLSGSHLRDVIYLNTHGIKI